MAKAIRKDGQYSGLREDGRDWPEALVGAKEIGGFLRLSPITVQKMLAAGRLPGWKDSQGRWMTTRRLLEAWGLKKWEAYVKGIGKKPRKVRKDTGSRK